MSETTGCTADWHLAHSRPGLFLEYFDPRRPFALRINTLVGRFGDVQRLCDGGEARPEFVRLRNELAFHLVKMSRWWGFDFCPRGVTGVRNPLFMACVKAHVERSADDEALFDLFTMQRHMHAGDPGHILVLGRDPGADPAICVLYGVDGQRHFRFAIGSPGREPTWNRQDYPDFASAWLAAWAVHALIRDDEAGRREFETAQREHDAARAWHQRHFHRCDARPAIPLYADAHAHLSGCRSEFGRSEFRAIVNKLAFDIARMAVQRHMALADAMKEGDGRDIHPCMANTVRRRARAYVATCLDPLVRAEMDALLDGVLYHRPRRCV
ncbi:hypothetical protein HLH33_11230 [Gluconacetobacter diazotrophicus]|uniref:Uncharacterized protein n=1 Tax=Gluconacetobacter diazotrophicus TaxID=33996 RepID=A0A7W4I5Z1_GLUDI|nr:hypothetical protein [Gluconacetobacter diazotrophicus]MBB2156875.1 hypothetical protein [Gluconacetobacter diazotrophicus]